MPNFTLSDDVFIRAAEQFPTPFHIYDEAGIRKTAQAVNAAFSWAPDFKEYFAVKALPNPAILKIFKEEGCGLDCSSECELLLAEMETVCIRYNPGGDFTLGNAIMGSPGESKYGWTKEQVPAGLARLKELGAKRFGLHAFLSSNTIDNSYYPKLAGILFELGADMAAKCDMPLAFVNLSGGIGIPYRPEIPAADIATIGDGVRQEYTRVFGDPAKSHVAIKTELGRYMTGPHGWLVTHVVHEKKIHKDYIGVDACASNLMRPAMYGAYHHIHVCGKREAPADHVYDVTGCLCENNDKFAIDRPLPEICKGDLLVIHDTGAHGFAMGYQYNGRLRSAEILYTNKGEFRLIRRAETPADYFATLVE